MSESVTINRTQPVVFHPNEHKLLISAEKENNGGLIYEGYQKQGSKNLLGEAVQFSCVGSIDRYGRHDHS
jgi:hypothetical protein